MSRDIYPDKEPADLRVPTSHLIQNKTSTPRPVPNASTPQVKEQVNIFQPISAHKSSSICLNQPTRPPITTTTEPMRLKTTAPTRPPTRPTSPQKQTRPQQEIFHHDDPQSKQKKHCKGECVSGLFALFCDDLDTDAFCPGEASCCITGGDSESSDDNQVAPSTTPKPPPTPVSYFRTNIESVKTNTFCDATGCCAKMPWLLLAKHYGSIL